MKMGQGAINTLPLLSLTTICYNGAAMTDEIENLVLAQLCAVRVDLGQIKETLADHSRQFIRVRTDIHDLKGDLLRHAENFARVELRLDRIEKRLGLIEA